MPFSKILRTAAWIILGTIALVGIAMLCSGCATLKVTVAPPAGVAIPTGPASYRATITGAPLKLALVSVDGALMAICGDSLLAPCYQQSGATLRVNGLANGREKEAGRVSVAMTDSAGKVTNAVAVISGWGRTK